MSSYSTHPLSDLLTNLPLPCLIAGGLAALLNPTDVGYLAVEPCLDLSFVPSEIFVAECFLSYPYLFPALIAIFPSQLLSNRKSTTWWVKHLIVRLFMSRKDKDHHYEN